MAARSTRGTRRAVPKGARAGASSPRKYIYDPVHGSVPLTGPTLELIAHPLLQRLWGIRQTGLAHLVFPGANHTRLEHSLGVLWVVRAMAAGLGLPAEESLPIEVAGFLHDLGHTPFSHTLEPVLQEATGLTHEGVTARLIRGEEPPSFAAWREDLPGHVARSIPTLLERQGIDPREVVRLLGPARPARDPFRAEMLHGSIDADRLDYLQRDAHYTGVAHGVIDANRLLETVRRERGHLVFAEKARTAIEGFLVARSLMYSSVYYNKTVRVAEVMLQSALERLPQFPRILPLLGMTDAELLLQLETEGGRAREIARRLKLRLLYKRLATLGWKESSRRARVLARLARDPVERRRAEDALAERLGAPSGSVLLDLASTHRGGHAPGGRPPRPDPLWVWEEGRVVNFLEQDAVWSRIASRPITPWAVAIYGPPSLKAAATRRPSRLFDRLG